MPASSRARLRSRSARSGLTVIEMLMALAIFLLGSVSIIGLFVTASVLHADAVNRRISAFIAEGILAEVQGTRLKEVFAKTRVDTDGAEGGAGPSLGSAGPTIEVLATEPDFQYPEATFPTWPRPDDVTDQRNTGALLIDSEWIWWVWNPALHDPITFADCSRRGMWGTSATTHADNARLLHPRTWYYVVDDQIPATPGVMDPLTGGDTAATEVWVTGDPQSADFPERPSSYIVIDEEWMRYGDVDADRFIDLERGLAGTEAREHKPGTPVTAARPHPHYPGFYYTVQFYPANALGSGAAVIVSVAHGSPRSLRRAFFFRTVFTPTKL
jgi:hypothetical protein